MLKDLPIWVMEQEVCDCGALLDYFGECPNCGGSDWEDWEDCDREEDYEDLDVLEELAFLQEYYNEIDPVVIVVAAREASSPSREKGSKQ